MLVINLFGGPGSGKSTMASMIFSELKELGHNVELVTEYAKDLTWANRNNDLDDQLYVFAKQHHRLHILKDKVEMVITDSPIILSLVYGSTSDNFKSLVRERFNSYYNVNIFLTRVKKYNSMGRSQSETEAKILDEQIKSMIQSNGYEFDIATPGQKASLETILDYIHGC